MDWSTHSLLAQFRPEPGWELDRACFASYSADIRVITAALLAVSGVSNEPESGSAIQLVQALRDLRGRVSFVVQRGRIHWPRNIPQVSGLLDRFVFDAELDERGPSGRSWHPKFSVMRWRCTVNGKVAWRVWLGSRNLTRDLALDAGVLLIEDPSRESGSKAPDLVRAVEALQSHLPKRVARFTQVDLEQLAKVHWTPPPGAKQVNVHWLDGKSDRFPRLAEPQQEAIVLSPFVDGGAMRRAKTWCLTGTKPVVVSSSMELQRECQSHAELTEILDLRVRAAALEEGLPYESPADVASPDQGDAESELDRSDEANALHAKLIYLRRGREKRLWIGSPNLTGRGWSRNVEIVAELLSVAPKDPWGPILRQLADRCERFEAQDADEDAEPEVKDLLEEARKEISASISCSQERRTDVLSVFADRALEFHAEDVLLYVGLPWTGYTPVLWPKGTKQISLGRVPLAACSDLLLFLLRIGEDEVGWLMHATFRPPLDDSRDQASLAAYLGPRGYLELIRAELETAGGAAAPPWDTPAIPTRGSRHAAWNFYGLPTLEGLLRLYLREPERLRRVANTVSMLEKEALKWESDAAIDTEEVRRDLRLFQDLWRRVGKHLTERAASGAA